MVITIENVWNELNLLSPKDFGVKAQAYWFAFLLFKLQKKQVGSIREYYALCEHKELLKSWNLL